MKDDRTYDLDKISKGEGLQDTRTIERRAFAGDAAAIAEELTQYWMALQHKGAIAPVIHPRTMARLQRIESRLGRLQPRQRTVLHLATGGLRWPKLEAVFGRLGGLALAQKSTHREYERSGKVIPLLNWLAGLDPESELVEEIGRECLAEFKEAVDAYARTALILV
ncbi:MAG TPA: hypothetical protein VMB50_20740 [Myxococcales bacterium]|nr:hypothetical protein [Myxococcales bacterium]